MDHIVMKQWIALGCTFRLERDRFKAYFYLFQDGKLVDHSEDEKSLLEKGWYL